MVQFVPQLALQRNHANAQLRTVQNMHAPNIEHFLFPIWSPLACSTKLNVRAGIQVMKRGGVKPHEQEAGMFGMNSGEQCEQDADGVAPNPREEIPENIQNMMSSLNMTMGPASGPVVPMMKPGNPLSGLAVKEKNAH